MSKRKLGEGDTARETGHRRKKARTQGRALPATEPSQLPHDINGTNGTSADMQDKMETRKKRKLARRAQRKQENASLNTTVNNGHSSHSKEEKDHEQAVIPVDKAERKRRKRLRREELRANFPRKDTSKGDRGRAGHSGVKKRIEKQIWSVGDAFGGQMLDIDPLFSLDEE